MVCLGFRIQRGLVLAISARSRIEMVKKYLFDEFCEDVGGWDGALFVGSLGSDASYQVAVRDLARDIGRVNGIVAAGNEGSDSFYLGLLASANTRYGDLYDEA